MQEANRQGSQDPSNDGPLRPEDIAKLLEPRRHKTFLQIEVIELDAPRRRKHKIVRMYAEMQLNVLLGLIAGGAGLGGIAKFVLHLF
jgi:hypothetical protein